MALPHLSIKLKGTMYWFRVPERRSSTASELLEIWAGKHDSGLNALLKLGYSKKLSMASQVIGKLSEFLRNWSPPLIISLSCPSNGLGSKTSCLFNAMFRKDKGFLLACGTNIYILVHAAPLQRKKKFKEVLPKVPKTIKTQFR